MSIKTKDELLESLKGLLGENTSDEALSLFEDVSDTITDFETKTSSSVDWEQKYKDNDKEWREKYRDRFFNHSSEETDEKDDIEEVEEVKTKFEDLFTQEGA
jgi:hypothetical protein